MGQYSTARLHKLIAEEIFQYNVVSVHDDDDLWWQESDPTGTIVASGPLPDYLNDMNAMGLVIEAMQKKGWWIKIEMTSQGWYSVNFWNYQTAAYSEVMTSQRVTIAVLTAAIQALNIRELRTEPTEIEKE